MTALIQSAYRVQRWLWRVLRPRTRGVKVMLVDAAGAVLLIRNGYGAGEQWLLPGGGVRPWETPPAAADREVREELGAAVTGLRPAGVFTTSAEGKRDTVHLFEGRLDGAIRIDGREVIAARWFAPDALPPTLSPATARRLAERRGDALADGRW